ncbi:hypothetical protein D3C81_1260550 [compost metagenome]
MTEYLRRYRDQLCVLLVEFAVIVGVPTVAANQYAKASGRGVDHVERVFVCAFEHFALIEYRVHLPLRLAQRHAIAAEHHAAVEQGTATGFELAIANAGFR